MKINGTSRTLQYKKSKGYYGKLIIEIEMTDDERHDVVLNYDLYKEKVFKLLNENLDRYL